MLSNANHGLNDPIPKWTSIIAVLSQKWWSTPSYRGAMKLGRRIPVVNAWREQKKNAMKKRNQKDKKEEIKNQKNKKKSIREKNQDPRQARHTSSWRSSSTWWFRSVSCYFGLRPPICKEEDANALYRRGLCASMTYPKSSQAINKPKNHKNKIKRNPKPLK